jgi:putative ABC transport system permease protein
MQVNSSAFLGLAWKNVKNRPFRNIATILCFAFVAASLFSAQYLIGGASHSLEEGTSRMGADMMVVPSQYIALGETVILRGEPSSFFFRMASFEGIAGVEGVEQASPQIYIATLYGAECCSAPVQMIAFDPGRDFTVMPWLESSLGRMLERDEIVVGSRIEGDIGSQLKFFGHDYTIAGRLEPTGMGTDYSVFVQMEDAYVMAAESGEKAVMRLDIPEGQVSAVLLQVGEGSDLESIAAKIEREVPGTRVITPDTLVLKISEQLQVLVRLLYLTTVAVIIISLPLIALVSSMVANERRREVGISGR